MQSKKPEQPLRPEILEADMRRRHLPVGAEARRKVTDRAPARIGSIPPSKLIDRIGTFATLNRLLTAAHA